MRKRTNDLAGVQLDAAVARAEGWSAGKQSHPPHLPTWHRLDAFVLQSDFTPSTNPAQGGEIIQREDIWLTRTQQEWVATIYDEDDVPGTPAHRGTGPTPLIAAMRAFVASKFGEEVEF